MTFKLCSARLARFKNWLPAFLIVSLVQVLGVTSRCARACHQKWAWPKSFAVLRPRRQVSFGNLSNPFPWCAQLFSGWGYIFSKIHCTRSEQALIYLSVPADRGKTYRIFVEGKPPEPCTVNVDFYRTSGLMLAMCFEARKLWVRAVMRRRGRRGPCQVHLRSQ